MAKKITNANVKEELKYYIKNHNLKDGYYKTKRPLLRVLRIPNVFKASGIIALIYRYSTKGYR